MLFKLSSVINWNIDTKGFWEITFHASKNMTNVPTRYSESVPSIKSLGLVRDSMTLKSIPSAEVSANRLFRCLISFIDI